MKKISLLLLASVCVLFCSCSNPTVSGTVTSYVSEEQGFLPDSGAAVYATTLSVENIERFLPAAVIKLQLDANQQQTAIYEANVALVAEAMKTVKAKSEEATKMAAQIEEYNGMIAQNVEAAALLQVALAEVLGAEGNFEQWENDAVNGFAEIKADEKLVSTTADSFGFYSLTLPKGEYSLVFVSLNNARLNALEAQGSFLIEKINLQANQTVDVAFGSEKETAE